jgi:hypothetical protein
MPNTSNVIPHRIDCVREGPARKARLGHDIVFLGCAKRSVAEKILGASHIDGVVTYIPSVESRSVRARACSWSAMP